MTLHIFPNIYPEDGIRVQQAHCTSVFAVALSTVAECGISLVASANRCPIKKMYVYTVEFVQP